jgi:hypothetical protein
MRDGPHESTVLSKQYYRNELRTVRPEVVGSTSEPFYFYRQVGTPTQTKNQRIIGGLWI